MNMKVIRDDIHISVRDKNDDSGFPIVNVPWFSGHIHTLPSYGVYNSQLIADHLRFHLRCS